MPRPTTDRGRVLYFLSMAEALEHYAWSKAKTKKIPVVWECLWGDPDATNKDITVVLKAQGKKNGISMLPDLTVCGELRRSIRRIKGLPAKTGPMAPKGGYIEPKPTYLSKEMTATTQERTQYPTTPTTPTTPTSNGRSEVLEELVISLMRDKESGVISATTWTTVKIGDNSTVLEWERGTKRTGTINVRDES